MPEDIDLEVILGSTVAKRPERVRARRTADGFVLAAAGLLILFAIIGIVSAGIFVANKVSSGSTHPAVAIRSGKGNTGASSARLAQARAQATAIVKAAQDASHSIVSGAATKARKQAAGIVAAAHRQARKITAAARAVHKAVAVVPPPAPVVATSPNYSNGNSQATVPILPSRTTGATSYLPTVTTAPHGSTVPNLQGLPASWLVVGYGASFGSGPGNAGSISVVNRGRKIFSGVATVKYAHGGSATAFFSGLAPGQSAALPLNGSRYTGGGYQILVSAH